MNPQKKNEEKNIELLENVKKLENQCNDLKQEKELYIKTNTNYELKSKELNKKIQEQLNEIKSLQQQENIIIK